MKQTIRIASIVAITVLIGTLFSPIAGAQSTEPTTRSQSIRCSIAQARLNTRITRVDTAKQRQSGLYVDLQTRVETFITSAKEANYDTTALEAAQKSVGEKITAYTTAATAYTTSLLATKNLSCGESDGAFATSLLSTRQALTVVRTAALDVRTTFREEAIPALKDYATWLKDNATTQTGEQQ